MNIEFEHNYQKRVMNQSFKELTVINRADDVLAWRQKWMEALKSWHSPYKALIDCSNLEINAANEAELKPALARMLKLLEGFFLKNAVGFTSVPRAGHALLPFAVHADAEQAYTEVGLNRQATLTSGDDLRSQIQLQNHFRQHTVELSFAAPVDFDSKEKFAILRSKLINNLSQWHSKWNLMIDCAQLAVSPEFSDEFNHLERFFKGLFLKQIIGYSPKAGAPPYPFTVYRSRHKAAAILEGEGNFSGDEADCKSRK